MQNSPFYAERRTFPRFPVGIALTYFEPYFEKRFQAQTKNISAGGLCFETDKILRSSAFLDIFIQMPDNNEQIHTKGKVVWSTVTESGRYRVGIKVEEPKIKPIPIVLRMISYQRNF
jgi:Tfp pilus assembly protein PilZ